MITPLGPTVCITMTITGIILFVGIIVTSIFYGVVNDTNPVSCMARTVYPVVGDCELKHCVLWLGSYSRYIPSPCPPIKDQTCWVYSMHKGDDILTPITAYSDCNNGSSIVKWPAEKHGECNYKTTTALYGREQTQEYGAGSRVLVSATPETDYFTDRSVHVQGCFEHEIIVFANPKTSKSFPVIQGMFIATMLAVLVFVVIVVRLTCIACRRNY